MCSISGVISRVPLRKTPSSLQTISHNLEHRGPDGYGETVSGHVTLSMNRLAIIDLNSGWQPLYNKEKSIAVVGNGEIYNYIELRQSIKKSGYLFQTGSDIETIIPLYLKYGATAVHKLRGMFAIALHDRKKKKVFLFRDRLGEKPLYYTKNKEGIFFASEFRALSSIVKEKNLAWSSIDDYFHLGYIPEPQTLLKNVHKLPAGHFAEIDEVTLEMNVLPYWKLEDVPISSSDDPTKAIWDTFFTATKIAMRADVPIGVSLSSGIDSSAIAMVAAEVNPKETTALTIGYKGKPKVDERFYAKDTAKKLGLSYVEGEIDISEAVKRFPEMVWKSDDPISEIGALNIHEIYRLTHEQGLKVLLSGVGGDELFWGYPWVRNAATYSQQMLEAQNDSTIKSWKQLSLFSSQESHMYQPWLGKYNALFSKNKVVLSDIRPIFRSAERFICPLYTQTFVDHLNDEQHDAFAFLEVDKNLSAPELGHHLITLLSTRWLTSHVVTINDRLSMANSVEVRCPLLDYKLFELVMGNKKTLTAFDKTGKYWFKKALADHLPEEIFNRPKKGFSPPAVQWLWGIIRNYLSLLDDGFLVQSKIIEQHTVIWITASQTIPWLWPTIFQLLCLEVWGRLNVWNQSVQELTIEK